MRFFGVTWSYQAMPHSGPASGVGIAQESLNAYQEIKLRHKYRYIIFRLSPDLREVVVEKKGNLNDSYNDFVTTLLSTVENKECRYAVYDFEYTHNQMSRQKLVFVLWTPSEALLKQKMAYTSTKNAFRQKLMGISVDLQATDASELSQQELLEKCCERSQ